MAYFLICKIQVSRKPFFAYQKKKKKENHSLIFVKLNLVLHSSNNDLAQYDLFLFQFLCENINIL